MSEPLLSEIDRFLRDTGMSEYRFGFLATKNGRLVERLRAGRRIWPETAEQVRDFMRRQRGMKSAAAVEDAESAA